MYYSITLILKHLKTFKTLQYVSMSIQIILRELVVSSLKSLNFKITKNIKGPLWQCGSIRLYGVLCGDVSKIRNIPSIVITARASVRAVSRGRLISTSRAQSQDSQSRICDGEIGLAPGFSLGRIT